MVNVEVGFNLSENLFVTFLFGYPFVKFSWGGSKLTLKLRFAKNAWKKVKNE